MKRQQLREHSFQYLTWLGVSFGLILFEEKKLKSVTNPKYIEFKMIKVINNKEIIQNDIKWLRFIRYQFYKK